MKYVKLSAVLLFFITLFTYGQSGPNNPDNIPTDKGRISGKVIDKNSKAPMEYCSVALYSLKDSALITGTVSDPSGVFVLKDLALGPYYLEIHFIGYEKKILTPVMVSPRENNINLGEVILSVNTKSLAEVEVVADQRRVEYKLDKKVVNVSEDLNAAGGSAVDVLENTPSVTVDIEGNVSLRGSSSFTVLINGKPTVLDAADALQQIPASNIQNIEIITNPSVKYDPDGNAGIINVVLKKQIEKGTTGIINTSLGLNHKYRFDALLNRRIGKFSYFFGGGYNDNIYAGELQREHLTYEENGDVFHNIANGSMNFQRGGGNLKTGFDYDFTNKSNLTFELNGGSYLFGIDRSNNSHEYYNPGIDFDQYYINTNIASRNGLYGSGNVSFTQLFDTAAHKLQIIGFYSYRNGEDLDTLAYQESNDAFSPLIEIDPVITKNASESGEAEYRLQIDYSKPIGQWMLESGYQLRIDDQVENYAYMEYDYPSSNWISFDENSSDILFFRNIQSAYFQMGGQLNQFQIQAGLRAEYTFRQISYENFDNEYLINRVDFYPTLHLARQFENDHQLMASYSKRVNRPRSYYLDSIPSYIDRNTIRIGNPGLEPEYIHSMELGYQKGWGKNFLAFETYYRMTDNPMERTTKYDSTSHVFYQTHINIDKEHVLGSEIMINWQFAKWFNLNASTDIYYNRLLGEINGEYRDNSNVSWRANTNATFSLSPYSKIQLQSGYHGPSVSLQGSSEGMFYANLAYRHDFLNRKLSATLQARNIFGTMKRDFIVNEVDYSQRIIMQREPRMIMLSLSYKINNYRMDQRDRNGNSGGEMDMESGF
jgi:outer membrane receptor protein involved in Fe transport